MNKRLLGLLELTELGLQEIPAFVEWLKPASPNETASAMKLPTRKPVDL